MQTSSLSYSCLFQYADKLIKLLLFDVFSSRFLRFMKACSLSDLLQKGADNDATSNIEGMLIDLDVNSSSNSSDTSSALGDKPVLRIEGDMYKIENAGEHVTIEGYTIYLC